MKRKHALKTAVAVHMTAGTQPAAEDPFAALAPAAPTKRPRGLKVMRVAKIDPDKGIAAIIPIQTDMRSVRRVIGAKHVNAELTLTSIDGLDIRLCCACVQSDARIWRVRGSLPVRGRAILYGFAGYGPSDFPGDAAWLKRMIEFDPPVERAINDPREKEEG
jgi:hypothetical protein